MTFRRSKSADFACGTSRTIPTVHRHQRSVEGVEGLAGRRRGRGRRRRGSARPRPGSPRPRPARRRSPRRSTRARRGGAGARRSPTGAAGSAPGASRPAARAVPSSCSASPRTFSASASASLGLLPAPRPVVPRYDVQLGRRGRLGGRGRRLEAQRVRERHRGRDVDHVDPGRLQRAHQQPAPHRPRGLRVDQPGGQGRLDLVGDRLGDPHALVRGQRPRLAGHRRRELPPLLGERPQLRAVHALLRVAQRRPDRQHLLDLRRPRGVPAG